MSRSFQSSRGSSTCLSGENLEQRINIKFCVKIGKSASEMSVLLTVAYGKYTMKKSSVFEWHRPFKKGKKMCKMTQEVGSQKRKGQMQMRTEYEPWCAQVKD
jgi:hypothetical protein